MKDPDQLLRSVASFQMIPMTTERETMPVFMVERDFAEQLEAAPGAFDEINRVNDEFGVRWLHSFLSADKRKTFCLYEADDIEAIRTAAVRAGIPADAIVELAGTIVPDGTFAAL